MGAMDAAHVVDEATGQASATISGETGRKKRKRKRDEVETAETLSRSIANSGEPAPLKKVMCNTLCLLAL